LNREACEGALSHIFKNDHAVHELHEEGFGKEIVESLESDKFISIKSLVKWEYILRNNWTALEALVKEFGSAKLLEQYSPRFRYRVPRADKSVGYFFSFMEILQIKLDIDEYSASQTTLEQIFNGFARNKDRFMIQREFT
jgi:ATP-binding cassette, subfamily A (ABC1), member 3